MTLLTLKHLTRSERDNHYDKVAALGCIICCDVAAIHHCKGNPTFPAKREHRPVIPLCHRHHQDHGRGVSFHPFEKEWESIYGTQQELLELVNERLGNATR